MSKKAVQDEYASNSICFGCGPSNKEGFQIKSYRTDDGLEMEFECEEKHQAFPGVINGGVIGSLIDCHGNWTAAIAIMEKNGLDEPQCTVTAQYEVKLNRPTPFGPKLKLKSRVLALQEDRAEIIIELKADGKTCATGRGLFVAVKEGHPAYHRWH
ncbi:MAG TPA: PaaI family thioesterase [Candidatus Poseidoniia archaeon]|jgi:acyl-coenzyme A thioesterase PaaI-like protein|nr:PaaI family thioesterase [Candidatus Poseidoniia archaeon]|tara:strand:- start:1028 stop:1495 length:468 start_codon:yes stop_codon:yes gene_type:complete